MLNSQLNKIVKGTEELMAVNIKQKMSEKESEGLIITKEIILDILKDLTDTDEVQKAVDSDDGSDYDRDNDR